MKDMHKRMMAKLDAHHERTMACQETTEAHLEFKEPTSVGMEYDAEHWEVPKEETTVKSSGAMKKQHRDWHLAAGHCGKPKELTKEMVDPEEVACRLQEDDPLYSGGTVLGTVARVMTRSVWYKKLGEDRC